MNDRPSMPTTGSFKDQIRTLTATRLDFALLLGAVGLAGFSLLDLITASGRFIDLLGIRVAALVGLGVLYLIQRQDREHRAVDLIGVIAFIWMAVGVQALIMATGGHTSSYYAGLNLILVGVAILMPWHWSRSLTVFIGIAVVYDGTIIALEWGAITAIESFATNNFFIAFTGVIMVAGTYASYSVRSSEYRAHTKLDEANRELVELDRFRKDVIANLSHEMRTPLTLALAPVETLLEDPSRTEQESELLRVIQNNSLSLLSLINDLLALQRIDAAMERLSTDTIDTDDLLGALTNMAQPYAVRKGVTLDVDASHRTRFVADRDKLERVLMNLLSNALKFTPPGGTIRLDCRPHSERSGGDGVVFTVEDSGVGIPEDEREHVFQRFRQVERGTTRRHGGTGIGLSLVREFVEMHGGKVWIEGRPGGGTIMRVQLRRNLDHLPPNRLDRRKSTSGDKAVHRRAIDQGVSAFTDEIAVHSDYRTIQLAHASERRAGIRTDDARKHGRILLVDDTPDVLKILSVQLYGLHQVVHARSGTEALAMTKKWRPSLIISDLMMPQMDGAELCRQLSRDEETASIPVVLLTARADDIARLEARQAGAVAYLTKPWTRAELLATIDAILLKQAESVRIVADYETRSTALVAEGIAHELRNPLGFVMNAQFLMASIAQRAIEGAASDQSQADEMIKMLEEARASGEQGILRIRTMVDQIAALGDHGPGIDGESDPSQVLAEVRQLVRPILGQRVLVVDVAPAKIAMAPGRLHQVALNLIKNATDAVAADGRITVHGVVINGQYVLSVQDDGPGIDEATRSEVFQPFFTTKPPGEGTGLGLAVSRRIVSESHGTLELSNTEEFTTFVVRIPLVQTNRAAISHPPGEGPLYAPEPPNA